MSLGHFGNGPGTVGGGRQNVLPMTLGLASNFFPPRKIWVKPRHRIFQVHYVLHRIQHMSQDNNALKIPPFISIMLAGVHSAEGSKSEDLFDNKLPPTMYHTH